MNYFRVKSALSNGIHVIPLEVECIQARRLPFFQILGVNAGAASELRERVLAAIGSLDGGRFRLPSRRFTIQVSPGTHGLVVDQLDLPVALSILGSCGHFSASRMEKLFALGRLGLNGRLISAGQERQISKILREQSGFSALLPWESSEILESEHLQKGGGVRSLREALDLLAGNAPGHRKPRDSASEGDALEFDWSELNGLALVLRILEISAAGGHHILVSSTVGAPVELAARGLCALLPKMLDGERSEVEQIYGLAGLKSPSRRPFHSLGAIHGLPSLSGDRKQAMIEELLLAHGGVLLIERASERRREIFERLRVPMRDGVLFAQRKGQRVACPARALVVAQCSFCPCGVYEGAGRSCVCSRADLRRHRTRIRELCRAPFDIHLPFSSGSRESSEAFDWLECVRRVQAARDKMLARQGKLNGELSFKDVFREVKWAAGAKRLWNALELGFRGDTESLVGLGRLSLTISDLKGGHEVAEEDLFEARHYFAGFLESERGGSR